MSQKMPFVFEHQVIDDAPAGSRNDVCLIGDVNGNGRNDVIIGGKRGENNVVWYENPTWNRHVIGTAPLEAGGCLVDIAGNGRLDLYVGNPKDANPNTELYWFECPEDPTQPWTRRIITNRYVKYHDQAAGDVDGDGKVELLFASQGSEVVGYFDIPDDPTVEPWPDDCLHIIAENCHVEGLVIADLDGDRKNEVIAGPGIFKLGDDGHWSRTVLDDTLDPRTLAAVGDLTGDGTLDIVLTEGELDQGKVVCFKNPTWERALLGDGFFHPHSLEIADFDGDGLLDILVAEMGLKNHPNPREIIFRNLGSAQFETEVVAKLPTHCAKSGDISGNGLPDIVGKPYDSGNDQIDVLLNKTERP